MFLYQGEQVNDVMVAKRANILIVDDEQEICDLLYNELVAEGYSCFIVCNGRDALTKLQMERFNVVLLDIKLPDVSGIEILNKINSSRYDTAAIMMTGMASTALAIEAMKCGASDFIVKPFRLSKINESIHSVLEKKSLSRRISSYGNILLEDESSDEESYREMDAIASGVEARHDLISVHTKIVTRETVEIAHQLRLPENIILSWAETKASVNAQKRMSFKRSSNKLEKSLQAQELLGLMRTYTPKNHKSEN